MAPTSRLIVSGRASLQANCPAPWPRRRLCGPPPSIASRGRRVLGPLRASRAGTQRPPSRVSESGACSRRYWPRRSGDSRWASAADDGSTSAGRAWTGWPPTWPAAPQPWPARSPPPAAAGRSKALPHQFAPLGQPAHLGGVPVLALGSFWYGRAGCQLGRLPYGAGAGSHYPLLAR